MYNAVRNNLKDQRARAGSRQSPAQNTVSSKAMQRVADATLMVMTGNSLKRKAHVADLTKARSQARSKANWLGLQFIDALLALLNDQVPMLPADDPYANTVQQIIADIQRYREQGGA